MHDTTILRILDYVILPHYVMLVGYMLESCVCLSVRLFVRLSVRHKLEFYSKTAKHTITQTTPRGR